MKRITMFLLVAVLAITVASPVFAFDPQPWCQEATIATGANGYDVAATGYAKFARVYDLTDSATVPGTDLNLGSGASAWGWTDLQLVAAHGFQVQVSRDGVTYTTERCLFTPASLSVVMGYFTAVAASPDAILSWETMSEVNNLGFDVYRNNMASLVGASLIARVDSPSPGGTGGWPYTYTDSLLAPGEYYYWVRDVPTIGDGLFYGPVGVVIQPPTAVSLTSFDAGGKCLWKTWDKFLLRKRR